MYSVNTDDYDMYNRGDTTGTLSGSASNDDRGQMFTPYPGDSMFNKEGTARTGDMTDFWSHYPVIIDEDGWVLYNNENTGINVRGPAGRTILHFSDLTPADKLQLKGEKGENGVNGRDGTDGKDGVNGKSAYELWLDEHGYSPDAHPIEEFFAYLANLTNELIKEGNGEGSLILNYYGEENLADGEGSLAVNYKTQANGDYSFAQGYYTKANYDYQAAFGKYNLNNYNNIFEVGVGDISTKKNGFSVDMTGNVMVNNNIDAGGEIVDGFNNTLSNKVDKIQGKGLSTNDFTNEYKSKVEDMYVDQSFDITSKNPIANKVVAKEVNDIRNEYHLLEQRENAAGAGYPLITSELYSASSGPHVARGRYSRNVQYDLDNVAYKLGSNNTWGSFNKSNILLGNGLTASEDYQYVIGKYNDNKTNNIVEIGYGENSNNKSNILEIDKSGNVITTGDIEDGQGNVLSEKQDKIYYDLEPTPSSTNLIQSGDLYDWMVSYGLIGGDEDKEGRIETLESQVSSLTLQNMSFNTHLENIDFDLSIMSSNIESLNSRISSTNSLLSSYYTELSSDIDAIDLTISSMTSDISSITSDISSIYNSIASINVFTDTETGSHYSIVVANGEITLVNIDSQQGGE